MSIAERIRPAATARNVALVAICGCLISIVSFGPRSSLGFFLTPMSQANGWGRDVFAFSLALQNLLWGIGQPFAGAIADRYGTRSEEHTSELQSRSDLVCRLLL